MRSKEQGREEGSEEGGWTPGREEGPGRWPPEVARFRMNTLLTVKGSSAASSSSSTSGSHFSAHTSLL